MRKLYNYLDSKKIPLYDNTRNYFAALEGIYSD